MMTNNTRMDNLFNIDSFNAGNCPKIALPTKMYKEYLYEYEERSVLKNDNSKNFRDFVYYSRDKLRNVLGIISILSVLMLIFYKERLIPIFLNLSFIFSNMLVSNYVPPTGKVENYLLSLAVFNAFYFIIFIKEKNFFLKKI